MRYRHDLIVSLLTKIIREYGGIAIPEPYHIQNSCDVRPDIEIIIGSTNTLTDVSIVHTGSPSLINSNAHRNAAKARETTKISKHTPAAEAFGMSFNPFVMESHGGIPKRSLDFLKSLIADASAPTASFSGLVQMLSVTLQRGNATIFRQGTAHAIQHTRKRPGVFIKVDRNGNIIRNKPKPKPAPARISVAFAPASLPDSPQSDSKSNSKNNPHLFTTLSQHLLPTRANHLNRQWHSRDDSLSTGTRDSCLPNPVIIKPHCGFHVEVAR